MLIWLVFAGMMGATVFALLWPLGRGRMSGFAEAADATSLYRSQLDEIERDLGRALILPEEAKAARAEAGRRLLKAADEAVGPAGETEASLRRRRASSALALSCVPLLALFVYGAFGSPSQPDLPLSARLGGEPSRQEFAVSLARIEAHLAANPDDGRGWAVLAPVYLRLERYEEAVRAFEGAVRNGEDGAEMRAGLGEARILAAGGVVTAEARETLADALRRDPANVRARYFLALAKEQDGDRAGAASDLKALLSQAPPDATWTAGVRQRLAALGESDAAAAIAGLPDADRQAAIRGMVDGLAARLRDEGGGLADWERLIRSRLVLGDRPAAREALTLARRQLAGDAAAISRIDGLTRELDLGEATP